MVNFSSFNSTLSPYRLFTQIFASSRLTICKKVLDEKFFRLSFFVLLSYSLKKDYSLPELCTHFPKFFSLPDTIGPDYVSLITITRLQSGKKGRFINLFFLLFLHFSESPRKTGFFFLRARQIENYHVFSKRTNIQEEQLRIFSHSSFLHRPSEQEGKWWAKKATGNKKTTAIIKMTYSMDGFRYNFRLTFFLINYRLVWPLLWQHNRESKTKRTTKNVRHIKVSRCGMVEYLATQHTFEHGIHLLYSINFLPIPKYHH